MDEKKEKIERNDGPDLKDALRLLEAFDFLEVGPVRLEKKRLTAPYKVVIKGKEDWTELIYSYEEDVFDPSEPASINLASMIAAQVAINYGLFGKKIIFHGAYDNIDKRFIRDMTENTAREIYVKKFLEHNPFLIGEAAKLPPVKKKSYLRAELEFPNLAADKPKNKWKYWSTDKERSCILSSGGKDSLLSYGLLKEIKEEVHPIFVNESGRHWFTALNAYRHFKNKVPNTARVWVNSERVFPWMLRHMPFIRKDFSSVRSDEYPIRLWTVAVFLFGVLPILRKRGIRRLLIGDEFDTTVKTSYNGITHYDGLYDQSRYFDEALSRYYMKKGWAINQFSVLRPLSEILIETILVKRYPELQKHQVSCHAAHKVNERIYPCGKCEKCRRIVGMLKAIDADPGSCGYSNQQISACLKELSLKRVHQEAAGAEHLNFMLVNKGLIDSTGSIKKSMKEHPEIFKLRFDAEKSSMAGIPEEIRAPLYKIFLQYSDGAVRRIGRKWVDINPFEDQEISKEYPFELLHKRGEEIEEQKSQNSLNKYLWAELTWPEAEERLKKVDIALLPVGAIEQHGPHLPLDTDAFDADYLAKRVAEACSDPKPLVLPLIPYGVSYHHADFQGTMSVSNDTLSQFVYEVGLCAARNGITKIVIINGHGDNSPALNYAAQMINRDAHIFVAVDTGETSDVDIYNLIDTPNDVHGGEIETSTSLALRPHLVRMDKANKAVVNFSSRYLNFTSSRSVPWYAHTKKISESGVIGDPTKATAEKGKKIWEIMIAHLVAFVEDLKIMTLEEIHQKKY